MADSLFDQEEDKDYLAELTGPGGKYDRTKYGNEAEMFQAIAKGKVHADKTLELQLQKNDELREYALEQKAASTAQAKFDELVKTHERQLANTKDDQNAPLIGNVQPTIDSNKIEEIAANAFLKLKAKEVEETNLAIVESRLREHFGETAKTVLRDKMNSLGLSADDIKYFARKSPEAVLNTLGLNFQVQNDYQSPPRSSTRTDSFKPSVEIRDAVYYEKLRQEKPKEYFSEKMSVQRLKDMERPDFLTRHQERQRTI